MASRRAATLVQGRPRAGYEQDGAEPGEAEQPAHGAADTDERQRAAMSEKLEVRVDEHAQRGRVHEGHVRHVEAHVAARATLLFFQRRGEGVGNGEVELAAEDERRAVCDVVCVNDHADWQIRHWRCGYRDVCRGHERSLEWSGG